MPVTRAKTAEEVREILTDKSKLTELLNSGDLIDWIEESTRLRLTSDPGLMAQTQEQTQQFMINWLRENGVDNMDAITAKRLNLDAPNNRGRIPRSAIYNSAAAGAKHDRAFPKLKDMLYTISDQSFKTAEQANKLAELKNDLSSIKPSDGGFLIPEILRAEILRIAHEKGVVRSRARVIPMDSLTVPFPTVDETSHVSSVYGGITGYWTEEGATLTESQPRFGQMELRAHKLTIYTEVPNELLRDARPALDTFLGDIMPEAMAWFEDVAFFVGGGVGEPLGFLNAPCTVTTDRVGSDTDTIVWADIVGMYARMLPQSLDRAVWVVSNEVLPQLLTMTVGAGNAAVWLGGGNFPSGAANPPMSMLGCPIIVSEKARQLGTAGDITFCDFGYYLVGDRQAMSARQSEDYKFQNDVTAFRIINRVDGRPWLSDPITPQNGGDSLSPFVNTGA